MIKEEYRSTRFINVICNGELDFFYHRGHKSKLAKCKYSPNQTHILYCPFRELEVQYNIKIHNLFALLVFHYKRVLEHVSICI